MSANSLYITAIRVPAESEFAASAWQDFYKLHSLVYSAFPSKEAATAARVLFRFDLEGDHGFLYVQSLAKPDWSKLAPKLGPNLRGPVPLELPELRAGAELRFRLLARPSMGVCRFKHGPSPDPWAGKLGRLQGDAQKHKERLERTGGLIGPKRGRRISLWAEKDQREWLERKGESCGFRVKVCQITERAWNDTKPGSQNKRRHPNDPLRGVQFDGVLEVTDAEKLWEAVRNGIGPQKGYGFGLLSLAPLRK